MRAGYQRVEQKPVFVHLLRVPKLWSERPFIGVAHIDNGIRSSSLDTVLRVVNGPGVSWLAGICVRSEGVHLQEKTGHRTANAPVPLVGV